MPHLGRGVALPVEYFGSGGVLLSGAFRASRPLADRWGSASGAGSHLIYAIRTNIGRPATPYLFSAAGAAIALRFPVGTVAERPNIGRIVRQWQLLSF